MKQVAKSVFSGDRANHALNSEVFAYCKKVYDLVRHPPSDSELEGYIRFKSPPIQPMQINAKIELVKRSKLYRSLFHRSMDQKG